LYIFLNQVRQSQVILMATEGCVKKICISGHTGARKSLMGEYESAGQHNGYPKWKSTFVHADGTIFLYRSTKGYWMVNNATDNLGWLESEKNGATFPVGLHWQYWDEKWINDSELWVGAFDIQCSKICISGHSGIRKGLMGDYELAGRHNGYPKWKSTFVHIDGTIVLYRSTKGYWMVSNATEDTGWLESEKKGASLPFDLDWQYWNGVKWINDSQLFVKPFKYDDSEKKIPELDLVFKNKESMEKKCDELDLVFENKESMENISKPSHPLSPLKMYNESSKKFEKEIVGTRKRNRWGDGLEDPSSGVKTFFPASWKPSKEVDQSLDLMGLTKKEITEVMARGAQYQKVAMQVGISVSPDFAAAIYAYTMEEPNVYQKLNSACRSKGRRAKLLLDICRDYLYHLSKACTTMPNFTGRTYRGINIRLSPKKYPLGEVITWHQMSSTTKKMTAALPFLGKTANGGLEGTLFLVDVKAGKEIDLFSAFPSEDEVLLELNSFFVIDSKIEGKQQKHELLEDLSAYNMELLDVYILKQR